MTMSSQLSLGHLRTMLYIEGTQTTINIRKIMLYQGGVPIIMRRVISPSTLIEFSEKPTKNIKIHFN